MRIFRPFAKNWSVLKYETWQKVYTHRRTWYLVGLVDWMIYLRQCIFWTSIQNDTSGR